MPSNACMAVGLVCPHRQACIEQQDALFCPLGKVTVMAWHVDAKVFFNFLVNIDQ